MERGQGVGLRETQVCQGSCGEKLKSAIPTPPLMGSHCHTPHQRTAQQRCHSSACASLPGVGSSRFFPYPLQTLTTAVSVHHSLISNLYIFSISHTPNANVGIPYISHITRTCPPSPAPAATYRGTKCSSLGCEARNPTCCVNSKSPFLRSSPCSK